MHTFNTVIWVICSLFMPNVKKGIFQLISGFFRATECTEGKQNYARCLPDRNPLYIPKQEKLSSK